MLFRRAFGRRGDSLRRCPWCGSRLVGPIAWEPADESHWHIDMRCGDCDHRWIRIVHDERAARFDAELNADITSLRRTLTRLDLERMAVDAETFAVALERDLIEPADFVP